MTTSASKDSTSSALSLEAVREYYATTLEGSKDLKTSACCSTDAMPAHLQATLALIHPEVLDKFYGCGSPIPAALEGSTVLDLGCGSGRDAVLVASLVGSSGKVIGVDMTEQQLAVARRHREFHLKALGAAPDRLDFRHAFIEDLSSAQISDESVDVVISNCVVNLSPVKRAVFSEVFRVLKPGGELYFSDIFADRRISPELHSDPILHGECLAGAMYIEDFRRLLRQLGCFDYRIVSKRKLTIDDPEIDAKIGDVGFWSMTVRAFKLDLEDQCEDFGQVAIYGGTIPHHPHRYALDDHHVFETNRPMLVCGNTADMLSKSRLRSHFQIIGEKQRHFGLFPCGPAPAGSSDEGSFGACC